MNFLRIFLLYFFGQIISEIIEEEVVQINQDEIPHHPGFSSSSKKNRKNSYQEFDQRNLNTPEQRMTREGAHYSNPEDVQYRNNPNGMNPNSAEIHNVHPGMRDENIRMQNGHMGGPMGMNNGHMGGPMGMNNGNMGGPMGMNNGHMGGPMGMNNGNMGGPMGMNNGHMGGPMGMNNGHMGGPMRMNEGMGHYPGGHHVHNGHQSHQNMPYSSNMNSNSNSWFSGTFGTLYEIMMILFLVGLVYNCIFGRNSNDKHAMNWYNANRQYFEERYEHIGLNKSEMEELPQNTVMKDSVIVKESPYFFKFYCSNYRYIKWSLTALEFRKRYDASAMLTSFLFSDTDKLVYEVAFKPVDPLGWVFCVCKKRDARMIKKSYGDLAFFTNNYEPSVMNERMCLLSENLEYFMELYQNKNLFPYYKQIEQFLDVIYFTDQASFCNEQFAVFFSFDINLTYSGQERRLLEITHFVNLFVDTLAQLKYKPKFRDEVQKNRINYERSKMEEGQRKEIEEKEKNDFIEKWKIRNKMKYKKGAERKKLEKELAKYN